MARFETIADAALVVKLRQASAAAHNALSHLLPPHLGGTGASGGGDGSGPQPPKIPQVDADEEAAALLLLRNQVRVPDGDAGNDSRKSWQCHVQALQEQRFDHLFFDARFLTASMWPLSLPPPPAHQIRALCMLLAPAVAPALIITKRLRTTEKYEEQAGEIVRAGLGHRPPLAGLTLRFVCAARSMGGGGETMAV